MKLLKNGEASTPSFQAPWTTWGRALAGVFWAHTSHALPVTALKQVSKSPGEQTHSSCWCSGSGVGPDILNFSQAPRWCPCCWYREHTEWHCSRVLSMLHNLSSVLTEHVLYMKKDTWNYILTKNWFHLFLLCIVLKRCL